MEPSIDNRSPADRIKYEYSRGWKERPQKNLEGIQILLSHFQGSHIDIDKMINEAAELISQQFRIDNVSIGLRDSDDGLYKYRAMIGFREDALEGHKKIAYKRDQFGDNEEFHGVSISKYSVIYLAEDNPLTEEELRAYNRPRLLNMRRMDNTESLEGDYIDTGIYGQGNELLGWIEISGTRAMKLPDVETIRWVEVIASILAAALMCSAGSQPSEEPYERKGIKSD